MSHLALGFLGKQQSESCDRSLSSSRMMLMIRLLVFINLLLLTTPVFAVHVFSLPNVESDVIGFVQTVYTKPGDTLKKVAERYSLGIDELTDANQHLRTKSMLQPWTAVLLPTSYILPPGDRQGIVINISEMRLYYYLDNENTVITAPVSIGREGWETPLTESIISEKKQDPAWRPPQSIREYTKSHGFILPEIMPPGPNNPLGQYALRLGVTSYMIHGTNEPTTIGLRISSGCIRMYPLDIEELYYNVPVGTKVRIINEPYKAGWHNGQLFLEAHKPIDNGAESNYQSNRDYRKVILAKNPSAAIDWQFVSHIIQQQYGYPQALF